MVARFFISYDKYKTGRGSIYLEDVNLGMKVLQQIIDMYTKSPVVLVSDSDKPTKGLNTARDFNIQIKLMPVPAANIAPVSDEELDDRNEQLKTGITDMVTLLEQKDFSDKELAVHKSLLDKIISDLPTLDTETDKFKLCQKLTLINDQLLSLFSTVTTYEYCPYLI